MFFNIAMLVGLKSKVVEIENHKHDTLEYNDLEYVIC